MKTSRHALALGLALCALAPCSAQTSPPANPEPGLTLNDIHSQLNASTQAAILAPTTVAEIQAMVRKAKAEGLAISISGGRHSMGGQQFGAGTMHLDMSSFKEVVGFDPARGVIEVQSGIQWPELVAWLNEHQASSAAPWGIRQKQTGADRLSIGGALSANIHGRGLNMRPMIDDVEAFTLVDADGTLRPCSRTENPELFRLAIGGYGLFGVIATVKVRLSPVQVMEREVQIIDVDQFIPLVQARTAAGYLYGDFQFAIDPKSNKFLKTGIYSLYKPVQKPLGSAAEQKEMQGEDWNRLLALAHTDKSRAFDIYSRFYLSTNGQLYRSDTHQMGVYLDGYHHTFDPEDKSSEMISEIYVPRNKLATLFKRLRSDFRKHRVNVVYGTVRLIRRDPESYLAWAKEDYASTVFNFHVDHSPAGIKKAKQEFRLIIDRALELGGSYFLTYHRWARRDQVLRAYPQLPEFLNLKRRYDPQERFQSDWYRHYRTMFADRLR